MKSYLSLQTIPTYPRDDAAVVLAVFLPPGGETRRLGLLGVEGKELQREGASPCADRRQFVSFLQEKALPLEQERNKDSGS